MNSLFAESVETELADRGMEDNSGDTEEVFNKNNAFVIDTFLYAKMLFNSIQVKSS